MHIYESPVECYLGNCQIYHVFMRPKRSWRKQTKIQAFGLGVSPVHWDVPKLRGIQRISRTIWDTWIPFGFWAFKAAAKHFRHFRCELKFENVELNFQTFWKSWILFSVVSFKVRLGGFTNTLLCLSGGLKKRNQTSKIYKYITLAIGINCNWPLIHHLKWVETTNNMGLNESPYLLGGLWIRLHSWRRGVRGVVTWKKPPPKNMSLMFFLIFFFQVL